jgi:hypothetical protein
MTLAFLLFTFYFFSFLFSTLQTLQTLTGGMAPLKLMQERKIFTTSVHVDIDSS